MLDFEYCSAPPGVSVVVIDDEFSAYVRWQTPTQKPTYLYSAELIVNHMGVHIKHSESKVSGIITD